MLTSTTSAVDDWYSRLFGVEREDLWADLTVRTHTTLGDYAGAYVAWRGEGVHVSAPPSWPASDAATLAGLEIGDVQDAAFWADFAARRGLQLIGPATHTYLDVDPGPAPEVIELDDRDQAALRERVSDADWEESGWSKPPRIAFGLMRDGVVVAASNLNETDGARRDLGVVVVEGHRGQGLAAVVGRHAASYAIRRHGFVRWGARDDNLDSLATSRRLGFEPWCTQLAVRA